MRRTGDQTLYSTHLPAKRQPGAPLTAEERRIHGLEDPPKVDWLYLLAIDAAKAMASALAKDGGRRSAAHRRLLEAHFDALAEIDGPERREHLQEEMEDTLDWALLDEGQDPRKVKPLPAVEPTPLDTEVATHCAEILALQPGCSLLHAHEMMASAHVLSLAEGGGDAYALAAILSAA